MLKHHGIEISVVSRNRCPWENGYVERIIRTLKEKVHFNAYEDIHEARVSGIWKPFITQVYHQKCPHSVLDYLTPMEFQRKHLDITLLICGLDKWWHFKDCMKCLGKANLTKVFSMVAKVSMVQIIERKE